MNIKFFSATAFIATMFVLTFFSSCDKKKADDPTCTYEMDPVCFCENNPDDSRCKDNPIVNESNLPDSIYNGSDFYIFFMDEVSEAALGNKVKEHTMLRDYDVWPAGETLVGAERSGINAWGEPAAWVAFDIAGTLGWNGGGMIAVLEEFEKVPDLTAIDGSYTFHFAIKSPNNQQTAGWTIFLYSEGPDLKYYFGPAATAPADQIYGGNYTHNGEWHHFEIPASKLLTGGYLWTKPMHMNNQPTGRRYLVGFQGNPHIVGTELNLDAVFFYKKPAK